MAKIFGWAGKILRVNLSERIWRVEPVEKYAKDFVGGIGIGTKIYFDEVKPETGSLDPGNKMIFAAGPLTGTLAPGSGRFEIVAKSPRSYPRETFTRSGMGGFWGPELKYAGYDALILEGKADTLVNLCIYNDKIEFRDAAAYRGADTFLTQANLRKEFDPTARILCIGPAGENLSRMAVIASETGFVSGRSGFGAVLGSKNVKAIAVRGTNPIHIHDPRRLLRLSQQVKTWAADNPMREWTSFGIYSMEEQLQFLDRYRKKNISCFGCPTQCFAYLEIPGAGESQAHCINYYYMPAAFAYYGKDQAEADRAVGDSFIIPNKLGLDTFELYAMLLFLKDLHDAGYLKESDFSFKEYGSREFIKNFLESIAFKKGIGVALSEGGPRFADGIRNSWEYGEKYYPAHGSAMHEELKKYAGLALMWALDSRDPVIDHHAYKKIAITLKDYPPEIRYPDEIFDRISEKLFGTAKAIDQSTFQEKAKAILYSQNRAAVVNLLVVCDWIYPFFYSTVTEDHTGDTSLESQLLSAVTGRQMTEKELDQVGERVCHLMRAIMVTEGRTRADDKLTSYYFKSQKGEAALNFPAFEEAKSEYYRLRGWDVGSGRPTREKLIEVGLPDVAERLFSVKF